MNPRHARLGRNPSQSLLATLLGTFVAAAAGCQGTAPPEWNDAVVTEIAAWRAKHEDSYTNNWATIEGLHFLKPGPQTAGSAPDA